MINIYSKVGIEKINIRMHGKITHEFENIDVTRFDG